ncbi:MAG: hypothetical protein ACW99F_14400 [Candidatus Hodarchaeales archaeon]|jgi:hypothetical protein
MASKGQLKNATKFVQQIQKSKSVHKFDLMDLLSISIPTYNQLKPYIEHRFGHYVTYNSKTKMWTAKKVTDVTEGSKVVS